MTYEEAATRMARVVAVVLCAWLLTLPAAAHAVDLGPLCQANKLKAVGKQAGDAFDCYAKAASGGTAVDPGCLAASQTSLAGAFTRAETRGGCLTVGDVGAVTSTLPAVEATLASSLRPSPGTSRCASAKLTSLSKRVRYLLTAYAKQRKVPKALTLLGNVDVFVKHVDADFASVESAGTDCLTTADAESIRQKIMSFAADALEPLWPLSAIGLRLTRPEDWMLCPSQFVVTGGLTIALTNFGCAFDEGGIIPSGGAAITVVRIPLPAETLSAFMAGELSDAESLVTDSVDVGGSTGTKATYTETYDGFALKKTTLFVPHGQALFKFYLEYGSAEPAASQFSGSFSGLLSSVSFVN